MKGIEVESSKEMKNKIRKKCREDGRGDMSP